MGWAALNQCHKDIAWGGGMFEDGDAQGWGCLGMKMLRDGDVWGALSQEQFPALLMYIMS